MIVYEESWPVLTVLEYLMRGSRVCAIHSFDRFFACMSGWIASCRSAYCCGISFDVSVLALVLVVDDER